MRPTDLPDVRQLPLFASMSDSSFERLMQAAYLQNFPAGLDLIREGDPADFLHVVIEGSVELFAAWNDREAIISCVRPVETFILAAVLKDAVYLMSARTAEKSRLLLIPSENVRAVMDSDVAFQRAIVNDLAGAFRSIVREHKNLKLRSGVERLANRLLAYHRAQGATGRLELPFDKKTLASILTMTPENLSRAFNTLKPYGVEVDGNTVTLADLKALTILAKPVDLIDLPSE